MTDITLPPLHQTGATRRARTRLSMDGVISAYVREIATHPVPGAKVTAPPARPRRAAPRDSRIPGVR